MVGIPTPHPSLSPLRGRGRVFGCVGKIGITDYRVFKRHECRAPLPLEFRGSVEICHQIGCILKVVHSKKSCLRTARSVHAGAIQLPIMKYLCHAPERFTSSQSWFSTLFMAAHQAAAAGGEVFSGRLWQGPFDCHRDQWQSRDFFLADSARQMVAFGTTTRR